VRAAAVESAGGERRGYEVSYHCRLVLVALGRALTDGEADEVALEDRSARDLGSAEAGAVLVDLCLAESSAFAASGCMPWLREGFHSGELGTQSQTVRRAVAWLRSCLGFQLEDSIHEWLADAAPQCCRMLSAAEGGEQQLVATAPHHQ
jgi:hypothetical protein